MATPSWIAPEIAAQAPKATSVAPASPPKAVMPIATTARALIAALIRSTRRRRRNVEPTSEAITSMSG